MWNSVHLNIHWAYIILPSIQTLKQINNQRLTKRNIFNRNSMPAYKLLIFSPGVLPKFQFKFTFANYLLNCENDFKLLYVQHWENLKFTYTNSYCINILLNICILHSVNCYLVKYILSYSYKLDNIILVYVLHVMYLKLCSSLKCSTNSLGCISF